MSALASAPPRRPTPPAASLIDPEHDDLTPIRVLAKQRLGKSICPATIWRWVRKGARGCRLEAVQVMGIWHTTPPAWAAFIAGQTAVALGGDAPAIPVARTAEKTEQLRRAGLLKRRPLQKLPDPSTNPARHWRAQ